MIDSAYLSSHLNSFLSLPTVSVSSTVWVSVLVRQVREHRVERPGVYRCCCLRKTESKEGQFGQTVSNLHIQIDRSGLVFQSSFSARCL